jgi:hypothetical protein
VTAYAESGTRDDDCPTCTRGWMHCHGTWVEHAAGGECTLGACEVPAESHVHLVACASVGVGCCEAGGS